MVSRKSVRIILFFLFALNYCYSVNTVFKIGCSFDYPKTLFLKQNDTLTILDADTLSKRCWYEITPIQLDYNKENKNVRYSHVKYEIKKHSSERNLILINKNPGTRYFAKFADCDSVVLMKYILDNKPIHLIYKDIFQIVVRKDDSYLGYLTELINVPFILPPIHLRNFGHQTDLRVGTDCAELAIYGMRRMGKKIPYVGPNGIRNYLDLIDIDKLFEGCIIHFGSQVSVLYQDNGIKGSLDENDLFIQSYENTACIISYRNCGFYNFPFKPYKWK